MKRRSGVGRSRLAAGDGAAWMPAFPRAVPEIMQPTHCPICYTALETREVAPCWDCGHLPNELAECAAGEHTYHEFRAFDSLPVVLCDFCDVDFGSYYASYFGGSAKGLVGE